MDSSEKRRWILVAVLLVMCAGSSWLGRPKELDPPPLDLEGVPLVVGPWSGKALEVLQEEREVLPLDAIIWRCMYTKEGSPTRIEVSVVVSGKHPKATLHQPEICFRAQGWEPVQREPAQRVISGYNMNPLEMIRLVMKRDKERKLAYYWFQSNDQVCPERMISFWSTAKRRLLTGRSERWALVRVLSSASDSSEEDVQELLELLWPHLLARWMA